MKLHLPLALSRALFASFAALALTQISSGATSESYPNGSITYTTRQTNYLSDLYGYETILFKDIIFALDGGDVCGGAIDNVGTFTLRGNGDVTFSGNTACDYSAYAFGGAIFNFGGTFTLRDNGAVTFSGNTASAYASDDSDFASGGAIYNAYSDTFTLSGNGDVTFSGNTASAANGYSAEGGAIFNYGSFTLSGNGDVTFSGNTASGSYSDSDDSARAYGGAIDNSGTFTLSDNGAVTFSGNTASASDSAYAYAYGGAIYNYGSFELSDNGAVTFSWNTASAYASTSTTHDYSASAYGGAIFNDCGATFTLSGNGDVTFSGNTASGSASVSAYAYDYDTASAYAYGGAISNDDGATFTLSGNGDVTFSGNTASGFGYAYDTSASASAYASAYAYGGAISNSHIFTLSDNGDVTFSGNEVSSSSSGGNVYGGAIYNGYKYRPDDVYSITFDLSGNGDVTFSGNTASASASTSEYADAYGGAISNDDGATFTLSDNGDVTFSGNTASAYGYDYFAYALGGAICNGNEGDFDATSTFTLSGNGDVTFSGNTASAYCYDYFASALGGAIYNAYSDTFTLSGNGDVTFSGNTASASASASDSDSDSDYAYASGGAICNGGTFTLSGNGDVLFEKNAEVSDGTYRLRSIYSTGVLNLSALAGKSILFKDSVYAEGTVNLNQDGSGDIIFTGISTEADLREVNGGVAGTAEEILNSRTSEFGTKAKIYGGRLIVEDGAILKGRGITVTEGANATIRLNGGTLNETRYTIAVSSGSGLEFEGENTLAASAVSLADNSFLSFILDEAQTAVNWNANLNIQGSLTLNLTHDDKPVHDSYALLAMQSGNIVTGWDAAALTISGTTAEHLAWENNTLYYRPLLVQENGDTTLDTNVETNAAGGTIGGKVDVNIDGNGHTLTVKNEVQLVQMALKDGIVKLEGENNGIVSVTLTEGGELVLSAGAGLTTGDIISMEANETAEMVISGDITLDNKGMKGKESKHATVSHADMQVQGDASISHVRVEDSTIDVAEGCTVNFSQVVLAATARLTDEPATAHLDEVTAELMMGVNTSKMADGVLPVGAVLVQNGNTAQTLSPEAEATVVQLEATTFDSLTLTGSSLVLELRGIETELYNGADYIALSFTSGKSYATFEDGLAVLLSTDGEHYAQGHYLQGGDHTTLYFDSREAGMTPEPATATLSLLALAALAARRKRK